MATYEAWNAALLTHAVEGTPRGASIFLSVDDDVLYRVAAKSGLASASPGFDPVDDFCRAVRERVVGWGMRVDVDGISGVSTATGEPNCVAFLAAMVLAASRMASQLAEGERISELNYFRRLREVLGLNGADGRPPELPPGSEEPAWSVWNWWLQKMGFLPTARRGTGPHKYIDYQISQTLLREADKERLRRLFRDRRWTAEWDTDTLFARVRHEAPCLNQHLRELLASNDRQRLQAVAEAAADLYELWQVDPQLSTRGTHVLGVNLQAGIYRLQNPLFGSVEYYLYPRQRRGQQLEGVVVETPSGQQSLVQERRGWYRPLSQLDARALDHGLHWNIVYPVELKSLIFPRRDFWILVLDQENPDSGIYASWGPPRLGAQFVLLCRTHLVPQVERLREERLIEWSGDPCQVPGNSDWAEVQECQITSEAWSGVFIENSELLDQLRPHVSLDVSVSGGLRVPEGAGWIQGYGPRVAVFGFYPEVEVSIINVENERPSYSGTHKANEPFDVPWTSPGDFRIEATSGAEIAERLVKIVAWDQVEVHTPEEPQGVTVGDWRINGAALEVGE